MDNREIDYFDPYDSLADVRFDDINDLVDKLNEVIQLLNDHEKKVGHAIR